MRRRRPKDERGLLTAWSCAAFLVLAPTVGRNPDGLEMLALARSWVGGVPLHDPGFWSPLWPMLLVPLTVGPLEELAWLLNLLLAGLVAWPLYGLAERVGGTWAARGAVLGWAGLPAVREYASVLDARPLTWLLVALTVWATVEACRSRRWIGPFVFAGLAALARPEGVALAPLVAVTAFASGARGVAALGLVAALAPKLAWGALVPAAPSFTALAVPWMGVWSLEDVVALYGSASLPTDYRTFAVAQGSAGMSLGLLRELPETLGVLSVGAVQALGAVGLVVGLAGAATIGSRGRWGLWAVASVVAPLAAVVVMPASRGQATAAANLLAWVPFALVAVVAVLPRRLPPWMPVALAAALVVETHLSPVRGDRPAFYEGARVTATTRTWLEQGWDGAPVASTLKGRDVVVGAGLDHLVLPSPWERWDPPVGTGVVLAGPDVEGEDGGRGLELLEDPAWALRFVTEDEGTWMGVLERVR